MDKCGKCGAGITIIDKAASGKRGVSLCSICLHQDNLRREKDEDAQMIKPKYPSSIRNKGLAVRTDDKGVITGIVHYKEGAPKPDPINHPEHYTSHPSGIECIEVTRHMSFNAGNVIKYLWRNGLKDGEPSLKDLKKAAWYLNDMIDQLEAGNE